MQKKHKKICIYQKKAVILQSHLRKVVLYRGVEQW